MTPEQLAAIRAYVEAATAPPWEVGGSGTIICDCDSEDWEQSVIAPNDRGTKSPIENCVFIARIRTDAVALLEAVAALQQENAGLKNTLQLNAGNECSLNNDIGRLIEENTELEAEVARLRAALAVYANRENWNLMESVNEIDQQKGPYLILDFFGEENEAEPGTIARKALEGSK